MPKQRADVAETGTPVQLDGTHPLAQYVKAALVPTAGSGSDVTEVVTQTTHTLADPDNPSNTPVWNADGSITSAMVSGSANGGTKGLGFSPLSINVDTLDNKHILVVLDFERNANNKANSYKLFSVANPGGTDIIIRSTAYAAGNLDAFVDLDYSGSTHDYEHPRDTGRHTYVVSLDSSTGAVKHFEDGVPVKSTSGTANVWGGSGQIDNVWFGVGSDADKFYSISLLIADRSLTDTEVQSMADDPYALYEDLAAPVEEYTGTITSSSVATTESAGQKVAMATSQATSEALTSTQAHKEASGTATQAAAPSISSAGRKEAGASSAVTATQDTTTAGQKIGTGASSADAIALAAAEFLKVGTGQTAAVAVSFAGTEAQKLAAGTIISSANGVVSAAGTAQDIRIGTITVSSMARSTAPGEKSTTGTSTSSAQGTIATQGQKRGTAPFTAEASADTATRGEKHSTGAIMVTANAWARLVGSDTAPKPVMQTYSLQGVLAMTVLQAKRHTTTLRGTVNAV